MTRPERCKQAETLLIRPSPRYWQGPNPSLVRKIERLVSGEDYKEIIAKARLQDC
jgi:hypothetical protein